MLDLGTVLPGSKVFIPVNTFDSNDPSASVTATNWANTDCHVHKDGGTTQRASSAGETLSLNFDSITGNHILELDLADNTTANFYEAGSVYHVRIEGVTVDAGTINAWIAQFRIGYPGALLDTTIATLASQTSFTLEDGSADDDAYNGFVAYIHDLASAVQVAIGYVSDYTGATKTVTLAADPGIFTMAAGDNISLFPPANMQAIAGNVTNAANVGTAGSNYSATRGLSGTALPAAAAAASGGLFTRGTGAGQINQDANGRIDGNLVAISGDTTAADNLEESATAIVVSAVNDASASTTAFATDLTEATDDHYNGRILIFTTGALAGQATDITDYTGATKTVTVTALTEAPADNDEFVIV